MTADASQLQPPQELLPSMRLPRLWSRSDIHPYDQTRWLRHDVTLTSPRDGTTSFSQTGAEFPAAWSRNAVTVVTSRYFRGRQGTDQRESSLRQIIDRVVGVYTKAGRNNSHLGDSTDADVFAAELTAALIGQVLSFNSPVWFNIGTEARQQASACVVLSVSDSLDSIQRWFQHETAVFVGGSGAGLNLSGLRSSKEMLASGARATGPLAFMRAADAAAGAIRSGGAGRGPARMMVLDIDHPDILEFIQSKAQEERKIRVLKDAGFDMDLNGADIATVQYQNANHAVRVSDDFMRSVLRGETFTLHRRTDGRPHADIDARLLLRQIAEAAWECGDPGIQFDDTINAWNTTPGAGRITATNGCSEYHGPDNSSSSIVSLNLLAFWDSAGGFDIDRFTHTVELAITALDIGVSFAEYPSPDIATVSLRYRPVSVGYANLGGLLMAMGYPYDSGDARTTAAAITSLMTGVAYRRSAVLAANLGAYDGYTDNADSHLRVVRRHAEAHARLPHLHGHHPAFAMTTTAGRLWQEALALGEQYGWRNCQVSLIPPTGTVSLMMDCDTTGVEPSYSLATTKKLLGGGALRLGSRAVEMALTRLGYSHTQQQAILHHIGVHASLDGSPYLLPDHHQIFATASGEPAISADGHLAMVAAVQPFLSGSASKTVNLSNDVTVEEVERIFIEAWRSGLKAVSVYRDRSKPGQPVS